MAILSAIRQTGGTSGGSLAPTSAGRWVHGRRPIGFGPPTRRVLEQDPRRGRGVDSASPSPSATWCPPPFKNSRQQATLARPALGNDRVTTEPLTLTTKRSVRSAVIALANVVQDASRSANCSSAAIAALTSALHNPSSLRIPSAFACGLRRAESWARKGDPGEGSRELGKGTRRRLAKEERRHRRYMPTRGQVSRCRSGLAADLGFHDDDCAAVRPVRITVNTTDGPLQRQLFPRRI
ncbi:hypothetical protein MRX96_058308 [Rhipicephalus microplus]